LHKLFGVLDHGVKRFPGFIGLSQQELFDLNYLETKKDKIVEVGNLFELMDSEDAPGVFPVCPSFTTEAGTVAGISLGEFGRTEPFVHMERRDRLFRSSNKIFLVCAVHDLKLIL
jgi:hypothetical protein